MRKPFHAMSRRGFLGAVGACLSYAGIAPAQTVASLTRERFIVQEFFIAGFRFYEGMAIRSQLFAGDSVTLSLDDGNRHDPNAIRVGRASHMLGYVPREQNAVLANLLAQKAPINAIIVQADESAQPWEAVRVQVRLEC